MGKTSNEVKKRWMDKAYRSFKIYFRYDTDTELMEFIDKHKDKYGTTNLFRDAMEMYMKSGVLDD